MVAYTEPFVFTFLDLMMISGVIVGLFAIPALLISKRFLTAGKTALAMFAGIAANMAVHYVASLMHF